MKLLSLFKNKKAKRSCSWKWRPFKQLKTMSFYIKAKMLKNSENFVLASCNSNKFATLFDPSWSQSRCFSSLAGVAGREYELSESEDFLLQFAGESIKTKKLFFEPGNTNLILGWTRFPFQDCVVHAIETSDPYAGFRVSMEEMAEAYGLVKTSNVEKDKYWEYLEGLLSWYLSVNEKNNHGFIIEAFIDMYAGLPSSPSSCCISYNASACSSKSKDCREININESSLRGEKKICPQYF